MLRPHRDLDGFLGRHSRPTRRGASKFILTQIGGAVGVGAAGGSPGSILPRRIKAPTTPAQNFRITDDGGKLRATPATWDDAVRGPSRQEGGMTRESRRPRDECSAGGLPKGWVLMVLPEQVLEFRGQRQRVVMAEAGGNVRVGGYPAWGDPAEVVPRRVRPSFFPWIYREARRRPPQSRGAPLARPADASAAGVEPASLP
jgi:hypothetical protein